MSDGRRHEKTHLNTSTELTVGLQEVDVVATDKVLGETNNGHVQTLLAVVIRRLLGNVTTKLRDLDFLVEVPLEASVQHLTLTRFETIGNRGDGTDVVCHGEEDKLLVDEVSDGDRSNIVVQVGSRLG